MTYQILVIFHVLYNFTEFGTLKYTVHMYFMGSGIYPMSVLYRIIYIFMFVVHYLHLVARYPFIIHVYRILF